MTARANLVTSLSETDRSRTCDLAAEQAYAELEMTVDWLDSLPDHPGQRIHCLFARLYLYDTKHWFKMPTLTDNSDFLKLFVVRFMDGYFKQVIGAVRDREGRPTDNWENYFKRTEKLTMRSNIFSHLDVVVTAFHTQISCDMSRALESAEKDYQKLFGRPIELAENRNLFFAPANLMVFQNTLLEFLSFHRTHQSLFRRIALGFFAILMRMTTRIWWPVLNGWRRSSWESFEKRITQHSFE